MDKLLMELEEQLQALLAEHEGLLALIRRKGEAVRQASPAMVEECTERENGYVQRIGRLEQQRQQTAAAITQALDPQARQPMRLIEIARRLDAPWRERLEELHGQLHRTMLDVQRESRTVGLAMDGLRRHVQGMIQLLVQTVGGGGMYGRSGRVATNEMKVSSFSTTG